MSQQPGTGVERRSLIERIKNSPAWPYCQAVSALLGIVVSVPAAIVAFQQAVGAGESASQAAKQAIAVVDQAAAATKAAAALEANLKIALDQVAIAQQQAKSLREAADAAIQAAQQSSRQAGAAEASAAAAARQAALMETANRQHVRARLEITDMTAKFEVGDRGYQYIGVRKIGIGTVSNIRFIANSTIEEKNFKPTAIKTCPATSYSHNNTLESRYWAGTLFKIDQAMHADVRQGRKVFIVHGAFCYDDETEKDLILHFCGIIDGPYGPGYCQRYPE